MISFTCWRRSSVVLAVSDFLRPPPGARFFTSLSTAASDLATDVTSGGSTSSSSLRVDSSSSGAGSSVLVSSTAGAAGLGASCLSSFASTALGVSVTRGVSFAGCENSGALPFSSSRRA